MLYENIPIRCEIEKRMKDEDKLPVTILVITVKSQNYKK